MHHRVHDNSQAKFETLTKESEKALLHRLDLYRQGLLGSRGFIESSEHVSRAEWESYIGALNVEQSLPGIGGIGIIHDVAPDQLDSFINELRQDGAPNLKAHPDGVKRGNFIITHIEPVAANAPAVGLNIAFEENRYNAAVIARDTGKPAITKHIVLVQDDKKKPGFLLLLPVYKDGTDLSTVEGRRAGFEAWVYAPFMMENFISELTESQGRTLNLQVYDGNQKTPENLIYDSNTIASTPPTHEHTYSKEKQINVMQQDWTLVWTSTPQFAQLEQSSEPLLILIAGIFFSGLLTVLIIMWVMREQETQQSVKVQLLLPSLVFVISCFGTTLLYKQLLAKEDLYIEYATQSEAQSILDAFAARLESDILALERMADRWTVRGGTPYEEWKADAEHYVKDQPGLKAVKWADANLIVRWVAPRSVLNLKSVGKLSPMDEEQAQLVASGADKNHISISAPMAVHQGYQGFLGFVPVFGDEFEGFIVGVYSVDDFVESALPNHQEGDFALKARQANGTVFYSRDQDDAQQGQKWKVTKTLALFGQSWTFEIVPTPDFINSHKTQLPFMLLMAGGALAFLLALVTFFAQRSQAKSELLSQQENLLKVFVKYTPAAVAMFDQKMRYVLASDRWYQDYGLKGQDVIGKSHYDIFPEILEKHPEWLDIHQRCMNGEVFQQEEELFYREDGKEEWLRYELRPWTGHNNQGRGLIMFTEVITERKQMERMKDEFVSTVNHELRTPLTSIQGALGLLRVTAADKLDEKSARLLEISYKNGEHLTHLVNDILDIEKIMAGKMSFNLENLNIGEAVLSAVEQNNSYAQLYNVTFKVINKAPKVHCHVDPHRFTQAISNLLSNAAKYSPDGGTVEITLEKTPENKVVIGVHDKGSGIPEKFQSKVFERFAQADGSTTGRHGGTGLGLSITKELVHAFGGDITFESEEQKGTSFYITLPIIKNEDE